MCQFLGFLRVYSSTVALVWNLHMGHAIPQYHVVFDDKVQTVFNDGTTKEQHYAICETLFEGYRECYVKEEFDESGIFYLWAPTAGQSVAVGEQAP